MSKNRQLKISVDPVLADDFREVCAESGVSMAASLSQHMHFAVRSTQKHLSVKTDPECLYTRRQRRRATQRAISRLHAVRDAEEAYRDNIPQNLQSGDRYESADSAVALLDQAIELLEEAFG
jgi:hypothetical protein